MPAEPAPLRTPATVVYAAAGAAILIWSGTPVATKVAVAGADPITVGILRTLLAALVTAPIALLAGVGTSATFRLPPSYGSLAPISRHCRHHERVVEDISGRFVSRQTP